MVLPPTAHNVAATVPALEDFILVTNRIVTVEYQGRLLFIFCMILTRKIDPRTRR